MRLWYSDSQRRRIGGAHAKLVGQLEDISGDCGRVWGNVAVSGNVSGLNGCLTGLTGKCDNLKGEVSRIRGELSGLRGILEARLTGDISRVHGDVTGIWGNASGLAGGVAELVEEGLLWTVNQNLDLEMFARRYGMSMEFFDNSGSPALIAFHALEAGPLHWMAVREDSRHGFLVGPMSVISRRFSSQEIIKVAVPSEAEWEISEDLDLLYTYRIYALEHVGPLVSSAFV